MKRIAIVAAAASLLVGAAVFAQPVPQSIPRASVAGDSSSAKPRGSFQGSYSTAPQAGTWSPVKTSFEDTYSGN
jgi:hypothetical protein